MPPLGVEVPHFLGPCTSVRHKIGNLTVYCLLRPNGSFQGKDSRTKMQLTVDSCAVLVR